MALKSKYVNPYQQFGLLHNEDVDFIFGNLSSI